MQINSSSHCSNIQRSELPFGILTLDNTNQEKKATAVALAAHVRATAEAFPPDYSPAVYRRHLCEQAAACAIADEDYDDLFPEMTKLIFFSL